MEVQSFVVAKGAAPCWPLEQRRSCPLLLPTHQILPFGQWVLHFKTCRCRFSSRVAVCFFLHSEKYTQLLFNYFLHQYILLPSFVILRTRSSAALKQQNALCEFCSVIHKFPIYWLHSELCAVIYENSFTKQRPRAVWASRFCSALVILMYVWNKSDFLDYLVLSAGVFFPHCRN